MKLDAKKKIETSIFFAKIRKETRKNAKLLTAKIRQLQTWCTKKNRNGK